MRPLVAPSPPTRRRTRGLLAATLVAATLVAGGFAGAPGPARAADTDIVDIPDAVLVEAVNAALGADRDADQQVTVAEAATLTSLVAEEPSGISDLTGLETFTRLTSLRLIGDRGLIDASPLAGLRLSALAISGGALQGTLDSISAIPTLSTLTLTDDRLFDVTPLRDLVRPVVLQLQDNQLADVSVLSELTTVTSLDLSGNRIVDVTPVAGLTNIRTLRLDDNRIADVAPLAGYANKPVATGLTLDGNRIGDLSPLRPFTTRPAALRQSVYAGPYQAGGVEVPLTRVDSNVLPIGVVNADEGSYDQATDLLTLADPAATSSIEISPHWTVHLTDTPFDPTVVGTPTVGQELKAVAGSEVRPSCEPAYQWQREGVDLPGATSGRYTLTTADIGSRLTVRVTCGAAQGVSAATASVAGSTPGAPVVVPSQSMATGVVGDPTNPQITLTVGQTDAAGHRVDPSELTVTATSNAPALIPSSGITMTGAGPRRTVSFAPTSRGGTSITFTVTGVGGTTATTGVSYSISTRTTSTSRVLIGQGDSSTALPAGDGYLFVADDERSELGLYNPEISGPAVWESATLQAGEVDFESSARQGDKAYWFGSHGNKKDGSLQGSRQVVFETTITGTGKDARLTQTGVYKGLRTDLRTWDHAHSDRLGMVAAMAEGIKPDLANGFNLEGAEFSPDGSELYLSFRSPVVEVGGEQQALIVPLKNLPDLTSGKAKEADFGEPILLDLDGHDIREIRKNDAGQYLIISGTPGMWTPQSSQMLFAWTGYPEDPAVALTTEVTKDVEPFHTDNAGAWEGIGELPDDLVTGTQVRLIMDQGYDALYNTEGENKKADYRVRKARTDVFTLAGNLGLTASVTESVAFANQPATTIGAPQKITVTNTGSERVHVSQVYVVGDDDQDSDFLISQNTCAHAPPGPGATCTIAVRFAPAQVSTTSTAQLVIESNLSGADRVVALSGTSTTLPKGEPGEDGTDGADGAPGAPGPTIVDKSLQPTVSAKALSKRRVQVTVATAGLSRSHLDHRVSVKVAGAAGAYVVKLTNGSATIKLTGSKARRVKTGKRVRVTVSVPEFTMRTATTTTVTTYTVAKASQQQIVKVRK